MTERMVEGAGVALAVRDHGGSGPLVLAIHGMASGAGAWDAVAAGLAPDGVRLVAYDRRGYGASGAPEPYGATTVQEQAEDAVAVLGALGGAPAVVVGDAFGALVALDLMKRHRGLLAGAVLADPPLFAFVADAAEALATERASLEESLRAGGPEAAVEAWLGGDADAAARALARASPAAFFADYAGLASWPVTRGDLRAMTVPAIVVTRPSSPPHVLAAADALAAFLPDARRTDDGDVLTAIRAALG